MLATQSWNKHLGVREGKIVGPYWTTPEKVPDKLNTRRLPCVSRMDEIYIHIEFQVFIESCHKLWK